MLKGKPFVKWAGGKRQIIDKLKEFAPEEFDTYYEPFIGGGALLFELSPKNAVINDYNSELINVYNCIKDENEYNKMCLELNHYEAKHSEEFYFEIRNKDRDKSKFNKMADYKRAARTIYLNKACFNGLYRVNSKNEFNVPFNKKEKVNTYDRQNLGIIHSYLNFNNITILNVDFEESVKNAKKGDFIYFDPPYDSDTTTFTSYTEDGFGKEEQIRLPNVFNELSKKGCYVMLSNHNTKLVNELYKDFNIHVIEAKRNINANGKKRGKVEEVISQNLETRNQNQELINNNLNSYSSEQLLEQNTHPALQDIIYRVITYLNKKAFKNFKPTTKKTIGHFKYWLSKGYKEEDFIEVIDKMTECWLGNGNLENYLRPDTLFGNKFADYLVEDWSRTETDWSSRYEEY